MSRIEQSISLDAPAARLRSLIADSAAHASFTGAPAEIGTEPGSPWQAFGGRIHGRTLAATDERIVQAWRAADWPEGTFSLVSFHFEDGTIHLTHDAIPEGAHEALEQGWSAMYWEPMRAHLAKG